MSTPPFQSKLIPYQKELFRKWYKERATLKQLQHWLSEKGIEISISGISRFIRCRKNRPDPHELPQSYRPQSKPSPDNIAKAIFKLEELMK